jgi:hypothetical protein
VRAEEDVAIPRLRGLIVVDASERGGFRGCGGYWSSAGRSWACRWGHMLAMRAQSQRESASARAFSAVGIHYTVSWTSWRAAIMAILRRGEMALPRIVCFRRAATTASLSQ